MTKKIPRRRAHAKKPTERAIMGIVREMVDPDSGELVACLVPAYPLDRRALREKELRFDDLVLVDVFKDRNPRFWRKFHSLSIFLAENVEELSGLKAHDALKRVQLAADAWCDDVRYQLEDGTPIFRREPKSLAFNTADEAVATAVWERICDYVAETFFPDWSRDQVEEAASFWEREE